MDVGQPARSQVDHTGRKFGCSSRKLCSEENVTAEGTLLCVERSGSDQESPWCPPNSSTDCCVMSWLEPVARQQRETTSNYNSCSMPVLCLVLHTVSHITKHLLIQHKCQCEVYKCKVRLITPPSWLDHMSVTESEWKVLTSTWQSDFLPHTLLGIPSLLSRKTSRRRRTLLLWSWTENTQRWGFRVSHLNEM